MNAVKSINTAIDTGTDGECPICTKNPPLNAVTIAAMQEAEDMISGKKPCTWYHTPEHFIAALKDEIDN